MKLALMLFSLITASQITSAHHGQDHDHDHVTSTDEQSVLYFSKDKAPEVLEGAFEHMVYNPRTGMETRSPLGNSRFPYSAVGVIKEGMVAANGLYAFRLSEVKPSFIQNKDEVLGSFRPSQFFMEHSGLIFLAGDARTIVSPEQAVYVIFDKLLDDEVTELIDIARWDECNDPHIRGNLKDRGCYSTNGGRWIDDNFLKLLQDNLLSCVNDSLTAVNRPTSDDLAVVHNGVAADDNHAKSSYHKFGMAIDIAEIKVENANGDLYGINYKAAVDNRSSWQYKFYQNFRVCWGKVQTRRSPKCTYNNMITNTNAGLPYYGSIGWEERNHKKHLHISMPFCGGRQGFKKL